MPGRSIAHARLGVYSDLVYHRDAEGISTNRAFIRFVTSLPPRVGEVVLFGRLNPEAGREPYALPSEQVRLAPLPYYRTAKDLLAVAKAFAGSCRVFDREIRGLDAVWIFGPQPLPIAFALIARARSVPVVLGVRQDYPEYIRNRLPSPRWAWAIGVARALDWSFRRLGRRDRAVVLGDGLAAKWRGGAPVMSTGFSLVRRDELRSREDALARDWDGPRTILSVGRLDSEKNPLLLLEILAALRSRDPRWRLTIAGDGPLRAAMETRIGELGLVDAVDLPGEVRNGPELWRLYRDAHLFLHVSFTEGLPQVLVEAQAAGLPIVATAVGGVSAALDGGRLGLLIPPADRDAGVRAVERLAAEPDLRERLITDGLANAERETLEAQLDRLAEFLGAAIAEGSRS
jgi:glycosyltransferase involved in cell wall biosynthesis